MVPIELLWSGLGLGIGANRCADGTGADEECFNEAIGDGQWSFRNLGSARRPNLHLCRTLA
ncbi:MAG: hypothetical protein ABEL04_05780 [Salinibacter sp.]|uniref:hypothetical protein n=1 Tax=Salinibacter sp. TaxID=2065818 RepID=UPI0035D4E43F